MAPEEGEADGYDVSALERLVRFGGVKLLHGMVDVFEESVPSRVEALRSALAAGDAATLQRTFHSLKSSAAQLGAMRLSAMSREGETLLAGGGSAHEAAPLVNAVEGELERSLGWMRSAGEALKESHEDDRGR